MIRRQGRLGPAQCGERDLSRAQEQDREQGPLLLLLLLGQLARVAAGGLGVGGALHLEELRAERLDLLLDRGADVERGHDRAEPARRGDRLQPRDARAEHEQPALPRRARLTEPCNT